MKSKLSLIERNKFVVLLAIFIALICSGGYVFYKVLNPQNHEQVERVDNQSQVLLKINDATFNTKIADSNEEWSRGLMHVRELPKEEGMLFVYPDERHLSFWMKNTYIPLDIIFINTNKQIIKIHKNTTPLDISKTYPSTQPAQYVLEINGGLSEEYGFQIGDKVQFTLIK